MEVLHVSLFALGVQSIESAYRNIFYELMPSFQINNKKHNLQCLQLNITDVCLTGPFLEEAIYRWPFRGSGKQAQFYACLGICSAQIFQRKFRLLNFLTLFNTQEWRWRKQVKKGLLVLAGIDFCLDHAQEMSLWEIARVLLSYSPSYFLDLFLGKWLAKYHQNKIWKYAFPLLSHVLNNTLAIYTLSRV